MGGWDEILKGTSGDDFMTGGDGDDFLQGKAGGDTMDGGAGNDQIHGDSGDDHLRGGAGNDFLNGGIGIDTAYYSGSVFEYSHSWEGDNFVLSHLAGTGADGTDRLIHVERLVFADAVIDLTMNNAPVAFDDSASTDEDVGTYSSGSASVLDNDFDWEGDSLTVAAGSFTGSHGTLVMNSDGTYTYTPFASTQALDDGESVQDSFSYTVSDGSLTDTGTLTITIAGVNDAPVANDDTASTSEDGTASGNVLANDTDVDGETLTVANAGVYVGSYGTLTLAADGSYTYTPNAAAQGLDDGETAQDVFSYTASDGTASDTATLTVTVTGLNDAPVANDDTASTSEDGTASGNVLANDTDVDGETLTVGNPGTYVGAFGTLTLAADGSYTYTPNAAAQGLDDGEVVSDSFSYTASDGTASDSATLTVNVTGLNDAPVANDDSASTGEDSAVSGNVLANDTDVDGETLTVANPGTYAGTYGSLTLGADGSYTYTPNAAADGLAAGESAQDVFSYTASDGTASDGATLTVTVNGANDAPTIDAGGTDASGSVAELPNDDPGENVTVHSDSGTIAFDDVDVTDTHSATATAQGGSYLGSFTLDPVDQNGDSVGWDFSVSDADLDSLEDGQIVTQTYTIEIDDGNGGTATQNVTITLTGAADGPPAWYIDNSAVTSANTGTQSDPFTSIAAFNAAQGTPGGPDVGHIVYLRTGTGTYSEADGINLLDDQVLIGVDTGGGRPTIAASAGDGVNVAANNNVSNINIGTTSGAGIADSGGSVGTLTVTDVAVSGGGQIVDIDQGGTINVTLDSAASTGSTGGAIDLNAVSGSFTVTGATVIGGTHSGGGVDVTGSTSLNVAFQGTLSAATGSATAINYAGNSGGGLTIGGTANSIATTSAVAVNLSSASNVSIGNALISSTGNYAVLGANVAGFSLGDSVVTGAAGADATIAFTNLTGVAQLLGNTIGGGGGDNVRVVNSGGTLDLTIADSGTNQAVIGLNDSGSGDDGVAISTSGAASLALLVDGVDFLGAAGDLLEVTATGSSTQIVTISDNQFLNTQATVGGGVVLGGGGAGSNIDVTYSIVDNSFSGADSSAITARYTHAAGDVLGHIGGNTIGLNDGVAGDQGSVNGNGITVGLDKAAGAGTATHSVSIVDNEVYDIAFGAGIAVTSAGGGAANGAVMEATVTGNTVAELGDFTLGAFYGQVGGQGSGDFSKLGLDMTNNDFTGGLFSNAVFLDQISTDAHYYLPGYAGSANGEFAATPGTASTDIDAYLAGRGNVMVSGDFAWMPGGVDASFVTGVTGDALTIPVFFG